jgi:hypothetical protein
MDRKLLRESLEHLLVTDNLQWLSRHELCEIGCTKTGFLQWARLTRNGP